MKLSILRKILGRYQERNPNDVAFNCPNVGHPSHHGGDIDKKLSVSLPKNQFNCWTCGYKGHVLSLIFKYGDSCDISEYKELVDFDDYKEAPPPDFSLPRGFRRLEEGGEAYLRAMSRMGSEESLEYFMVGESDIYKGCPILVFRDWDGNPNYWIVDYHNRKKKNEPKYVGGFVWVDGTPENLPLPKGLIDTFSVDFGKPLVIVEGAYDKYAFYPYTNVVPLLGKNFTEAMRDDILKGMPPLVILFLDGDDSKAVAIMETIKDELEGYGQRCIIIESGEDPNSLKGERLRETVIGQLPAEIRYAPIL